MAANDKQIVSDANQKQIAGTHYKQTAIQPWDYVAANNLGYFEGSAIKYITRWRNKGGIADIQKAIHFLEKLIELESPALDPMATTQTKSAYPYLERATKRLSDAPHMATDNRDTYCPPSASFWDELNKVTEQWVMSKQERDIYHGG